MDPLTIGLGLAQLVPGMIRLFGGGDKAEKVAEKVVDIAKTVTGQDTGEAALEALKADPNKILEFQRAIEAQRVDLRESVPCRRCQRPRNADRRARARGSIFQAIRLLFFDGLVAFRHGLLPGRDLH